MANDRYAAKNIFNTPTTFIHRRKGDRNLTNLTTH